MSLFEGSEDRRGGALQNHSPGAAAGRMSAQREAQFLSHIGKHLRMVLARTRHELRDPSAQSPRQIMAHWECRLTWALVSINRSESGLRWVARVRETWGSLEGVFHVGHLDE
jgi:hypothetical protein